MATFDEFYSSLDSDPRIRGKHFKKFVKWFFKNDPVWAAQVKVIQLWEHPKRSEWECKEANYRSNKLKHYQIIKLQSLNEWTWESKRKSK